MNHIAADERLQNVALFLIILAAFSIGVGEFMSWIHLVDFANVFGGGGVGILTGNRIAKKMAQPVQPEAQEKQ